MFVIHVSSECYPAAKVGGLGDVVGALPKYLNKMDCETWVVMPKYKTPWILKQNPKAIYSGIIGLENNRFQYNIYQITEEVLGFPLILIDIPGFTDREGVYADPSSGEPYWDEFQRYVLFQKAFLLWVKTFDKKPDIIHCHDHHTALIPFMMTQAHDFSSLKTIPTILTIHNGEYHGRYPFSYCRFLPKFDWHAVGLLEWQESLNALASGIKTAWKVTTVSNSYMQELQYNSNGLESLLVKEENKCVGIVNGIDSDFWDPETDYMVSHNYNIKDAESGKLENKKALASKYGMDIKRPLFTFIGRLVTEKGADILPNLVFDFLQRHNDAHFFILGTGSKGIEYRIKALSEALPDNVTVELRYDEILAHQLYAASDFLLMPSRVEPCGLNQMYALRYGAIPIVRAVGGLRETIIDIEEKNGYGIKFYDFNISEALIALERALTIYNDKNRIKNVVKRGMALNFSWNSSALNYIKHYTSMLKG